MHEIDIMDIGGFKIGQAEDTKGLTGCTVFLFDKQSPAGVDIRGGGPASRETPLLNPVADAKGIHALVLSGGSAFGLDAAGGVMKYLEERDIGFDVGVTKVPLVVQSCIFDLVKWHTRLVRTLPMIPFYREIMEPEWVQQSANIWGVSAA